jgi:hypothetical protein
MVTLPSAVEGLAQTLEADGTLTLSWRAPTTNMAGRDLATLDHFEVWGSDWDLGGFCAGCPSRPAKLADVHLQPPAPGQTINVGPYAWRTRPRPGRAHVYRVAGFSARGAVNPAAWSETVVYMVETPGAMALFAAEADDLSVSFRYPAPEGDLSVEIQRSQDGGPFETLDPGRDARLDTSVAYGRRYAYRARLVRSREGTRMPGPWTSEILLAIEDNLPPPPPAHLDAALAPDGVRLVWESLAERGDVAGYVVYRGGEDGPFRRLTAEPVTANVFVDRSAAPGRAWRYRVTAVDDSPRRNESAPSPEAAVLTEGPLEAAPPERPETPDPGI